MSLSDAIARFRGLDEANISAPKVDRPLAGGKKQMSPKSKWKHYGGANQDYEREPVSVPSDPEAKAAAVRSTAGVSGPGYDASAREYVDVRQEDDERRQERGRGVGIDDFHEQESDDDLAFAEAMLNDTLGRKGPSQQEANIPAPKVDRKVGKGKQQMSPKSKFARQYYKGPGQDYKGDAANMPADPEAKAAAVRSTAGVSGPGYGPDGREEVDVRVESFDPENLEYPDELIGR